MPSLFICLTLYFNFFVILIHVIFCIASIIISEVYITYFLHKKISNFQNSLKNLIQKLKCLLINNSPTFDAIMLLTN